MKKVIVCLLIVTMFIQIGCSSSKQIPYPADQRKNENEIRSLNYFGERLSSTIQLTNSFEIEAYWLNLRGDKIYFLTEGLVDTSSVNIDKVKTVRFYDVYGGCMKGGWLGLGLILIEGIAAEAFVSKGAHNEGVGYAILVIAPITMLLSTAYGIAFLGDREFNFVQSKSVRE